MIAATVFTLAFLFVGLGTVLVAMRGGPRGLAHARRTPSRRARRATTIGLPILLLVLAIGVPALVLARNGDHHSDVGPGGLLLTTNSKTHVDQVHGRHVFAEHCATCHALHGANAVGKVGPNLDSLIGGLGGTPQTRISYILDAIKQGRARGLGQMPAQLVVGRDATDVASFIAAVAGH